MQGVWVGWRVFDTWVVVVVVGQVFEVWFGRMVDAPKVALVV